MAPPVNQQRFSAIAHGDMPIWNPLGMRQLDDAIEQLALPTKATILDVGCGRAHLLFRLVETFDARGIGVDSSELAIDAAREALAQSSCSNLVDLRCEAFHADSFEAAALDLVVCIGATHAFGDYRTTLHEALRLLTHTGQLLVAEGFWEQDPDPEYVEFLGGKKEDLLDHTGNEALGRELGYDLLWSQVTSRDDWHAYETTYAKNIERHVASHPDDPEADAMLAKIRRWHNGYLRWGRTTLGFGLYLFRMPE